MVSLFVKSVPQGHSQMRDQQRAQLALSEKQMAKLEVLATGVMQVRMRLDKVRLIVFLVQPATFLELAGVIVIFVSVVRKKRL
jgi:hypothetical protein